MNIKHIWFDFTDTIAVMEKSEFDKLIYSSYAEVVGKDITPELISEYKALLATQKSNSSVFKSLGLPSDHLSGRASNLTNMYRLTDQNIPRVVQRLAERVPVSIFSNARLNVVLPALGLEVKWFTDILGPDQVENPKPALDGFYKIIELSKLPAGEILYIGDDVSKDIAPAKRVGLQTGLLWKKSPEADHCFEDFSAIEKVLD